MRLYEIQHDLRALSYFDVFGRLRLTLQLARVTLSIPMAIDKAMKEEVEQEANGDTSQNGEAGHCRGFVEEGDEAWQEGKDGRLVKRGLLGPRLLMVLGLVRLRLLSRFTASVSADHLQNRFRSRRLQFSRKANGSCSIAAQPAARIAQITKKPFTLVNIARSECFTTKHYPTRWMSKVSRCTAAMVSPPTTLHHPLCSFLPSRHCTSRSFAYAHLYHQSRSLCVSRKYRSV